ncbi:MAG: hypothetical protein U1F60_13185 [Planctomycetota bacterium]
MNQEPIVLAAADLCGRDVVALHARLGAPDCCAFRGHTVHLGYRRPDGALQPSAVVLQDGVVVQAPGRLRRNRRAQWGGRLVHEALSAFGRLLGLYTLPAGLEVVCEGARLFVHEERIVHAEPPPQGLGIWVLPGSREAGLTAAG